MSELSDPGKEKNTLRDQIIGLGTKSVRKSYYPQLQRQIDELKEAKGALEEKSTSLLRTLSELETAKRRAEETERSFRTLYEKISDGILVGSLSTYHVKMANPAFCRMLGYTEKELLRMGAYDLHPIQELPRVADTTERLKRGEAETLGLRDVRYRRKDGTIIYADVNVSTIEIRDRNYIIAACNEVTERKLAEQALIHEQKFSRALVESITDAIVACDARFELTVFNRASREWHPRATENVPPERLPEVFGIYHPDGDLLNPSEVPLYRAFMGETVKDYPMVIRTEGQPPRYVLASSVPFFDEKGKKLGAVVVMHDITQRKLAEEALKRAEVFANAVINSVPGLLYLYDDHGRLVRWNRQYEVITGYSPEDLYGKHYLKCFRQDPSDTATIEQCVLKCLADGYAEAEAHLETKAGLEALFHFTAVRLQIDGKHYFAGIGIDITEQRRAENELLRLNRLYAILSEVNQAVVHSASHEELLVTVCNAAAAYGMFTLVWVGKLEGESRRVTPVARAGSQVGFLDQIGVYVDDRPEGRGVVGRAIRDARTVVANDYLSDPGVYWIEEARRAGIRASISIPITNQGRIYGALNLYSDEFNVFQDKEVKLLEEVAADISFALDHLDQEARRQQNEAALKKAKEDAEAANQAKDQFIAVLSHELRTPLTPVLTAASFLQNLTETPEDIKPELDIIRRNVELEARLIDDLLDVTRISRGLVQLHREEVDVHAALMKTLEICGTEISQKAMEVVLRLDAADHFVSADSARLQQVFWNLLKNALKFTPAEGRIAISTRNADGRIRIEVADSGIGIAPEALTRIFKAFEQGEKTWTRRFGGLGLGLSIAKAIVELHHGTIAASSEGEGRGAVFAVVLDTIAPALRAPARVRAAPRPREAKQWKILLVEDNIDTLRIMSRLLESWGYEVRCADSLAKASALAGSESFDLLISDIGLPDGSGLEVMRRIKQKHEETRGIAITGYGTDEDIRQSRAAGFAEHLTKPVSIDGLRAAIDRILAAA